MKQLKNGAFVLAIALCLAACGNGSQQVETAQTTSTPSTARQNDSAFNAGFQKVLASYFSLRDGLIDWDTAKANLAAGELATNSDSLDLSGLPNDTSASVKKTADIFAGTIAGSAKALVKESDIQKKRKEFQMISDALYDLAGSVSYDGEKLYRMKCPMAFNDSEEAFWVSDVSEIKNPYLGTKHPKYKNKMLECGEVTDSIGSVSKAMLNKPAAGK